MAAIAIGQTSIQALSPIIRNTLNTLNNRENTLNSQVNALRNPQRPAFIMAQKPPSLLRPLLHTTGFDKGKARVDHPLRFIHF